MNLKRIKKFVKYFSTEAITTGGEKQPLDRPRERDKNKFDKGGMIVVAGRILRLVLYKGYSGKGITNIYYNESAPDSALPKHIDRYT